MPRFVILLSADALIHASVFCCGSARFHGVTENTLITLHGKLNIVAQVVARFALPYDAPLLRNGLNMLASLCVARDRTDCRLMRWNDHLCIGLLV